MPITTSAKKALRQNAKRHIRNIVKKQAVKTARKAYIAALKNSDTKAMQEKLRAVYQTLDKAAKTNVISKGKAKRLKSRMAKRLARTK